MKILKAIAISFSMYSGIPMPQFEWKDEDMKYILCFFPWIGLAIGGLLYLWSLLCTRFCVGKLCYSLIGAAIPILVTGGFHVDGFMDSMDAFHSYRPREKKLEILKDSHIGAFAVIMLAVYGLLYIGAFSEITNRKLYLDLCAGFVLSRCLSGLGVVAFPSAKKDGLLVLFANNAHKQIVTGSLILQAFLCIGFMLFISPIGGGVITGTALVSFGYYYRKCKKELGGITGDTAGYFILLCEGSMVVMTAVLEKGLLQ